ncbi:MAG: lysylphosphatidylglycerol synthase transmembrane domain-containing protein [Bacteroidia bacterium]|nr:lysylphosphatidylglycerol synthase transmembrane domain-containing protein [Bacteroidia bacterium]
MSNQLKTILQFIIGIALAGGLLYYVYQDTKWEDLSNDLSKADIFWVLMSGLTLFGVFVARTLRWQMMLESSGFHPKKKHTLLSVLVLYLVNSVTPKIGEIVRCTILYRTDKVPVASGLGTVVAERVIDALVLFGGLGLIFLFEIERLGSLFGEIFDSLSEQFGGIDSSILIGGLIGLLLLGIAGIWFLSSKKTDGDGLIGKTKTFALNMLEAGKSIFQLEKPWLFLVYTIMIWGLLTLMNYFFILSLPDTSELGLYFAILILFIGGIGWALPVPGGMGSTHFIVVQLFLAFGLSEKAGLNIGALSNGVTWIFSVGYGLIALAILIPLISRSSQNDEGEKS